MTPTPVALLCLSPPAGESINPRVAGLIGRSGPQNKQPFMVAFFKATEVHLRSIRSASGGAKQRNPNRSKGAKSQEALRVANVAGKHAESVCGFFLFVFFVVVVCSQRWFTPLSPAEPQVWSGFCRAMWGIRGIGHRWLVGLEENSLHFWSDSTFMQTLTSVNKYTRYPENRQKSAVWPLWFLPDKTRDARSGPLF